MTPTIFLDEGTRNWSYNTAPVLHAQYLTKTFLSLFTTIISWIIYTAAKTRHKAGKCIRVKSCRNCLQSEPDLGHTCNTWRFEMRDACIGTVAGLNNDVPPYTSNKLKWKRLHWTNLHNNDRFACWGYGRHDPSLSFTLTCQHYCHRYLLALLYFNASHDLFSWFCLSSELQNVFIWKKLRLSQNCFLRLSAEPFVNTHSYLCLASMKENTATIIELTDPDYFSNKYSKCIIIYTMGILVKIRACFFSVWILLYLLLHLIYKCLYTVFFYFIYLIILFGLHVQVSCILHFLFSMSVWRDLVTNIFVRSPGDKRVYSNVFVSFTVRPC